ncbi:MAG: GH36 C-terminal domain-containing protein, partial [Planctomycetota bacterium]|nr:GH36 C-terminal domain-containing protein [Planctomycetota bacterium]
AAYQMHRPDLEKGLVMVFRRRESPYTEATYRLRGLRPGATYLVEDADSGRKQRWRGADLLEKGLPVAISRPHESRLFFYECQPAHQAQRAAKR